MFQHTWHFLLFALTGFINRQQQDIIEYYREEHRVLREKPGKKRLILNVAQKRRLAMAAMKLGRNVLDQCVTLFTPETLVRWHRMLVATNMRARANAGPTPVKANQIRDLVLTMNAENPDWDTGISTASS